MKWDITIKWGAMGLKRGKKYMKIGNISNIGEIRTNFEFIEIENEGRGKEFCKNM